MRIWDIHPGYLSQKSLLGEHSEIHALYSILSDHRKGFSNHPETLRWSGNLNSLIMRHELIAKEMILRKIKHQSPISFLIKSEGMYYSEYYINFPEVQIEILRERYLDKPQIGRIPLPERGTEYWAHHKYSVMARGYRYYKEVQKYIKQSKDCPISQEHDLLQKIQLYIQKPISIVAINNVIEHLWGYVNIKSLEREKMIFFDMRNSSAKLDYLFKIAKKYQEKYLLHSTIFADFIPIKEN